MCFQKAKTSRIEQITSNSTPPIKKIKAKVLRFGEDLSDFKDDGGTAAHFAWKYHVPSGFNTTVITQDPKNLNW